MALLISTFCFCCLVERAVCSTVGSAPGTEDSTAAAFAIALPAAAVTARIAALALVDKLQVGGLFKCKESFVRACEDAAAVAGRRMRAKVSDKTRNTQWCQCSHEAHKLFEQRKKAARDANVLFTEKFDPPCDTIISAILKSIAALAGDYYFEVVTCDCVVHSCAEKVEVKPRSREGKRAFDTNAVDMTRLSSSLIDQAKPTRISITATANSFFGNDEKGDLP
jgi:hypothetical protein